MADTIAVMNAGRHRAARRPRPSSTRRRSTTFAANFLGQSNLLPGTVTGAAGDDLPRSTCTADRCALPASRCRAPTRRRVAGRPAGEAPHPSPTPPTRQAATRCHGSVTDASFTGRRDAVPRRACRGASELTVVQQNDGTPRCCPRRAKSPSVGAGAQLRASTRPRTRDAGAERRRGRGAAVARLRTVTGGTGTPAPPASRARRAHGRPTCCSLPGMLWLRRLLRRADDLPRLAVAADGPLEHGYTLTLALRDVRRRAVQLLPQFVRSLVYAASPLLARCSSATRSPTPSRSRPGRWKNILLVLVIAPFFTSFLIRTLAWQTILATTAPSSGASGAHRT